MRNLKKDGSKYSIITYPNHKPFQRLTTRKTQLDIFENQCLLRFSLAPQKFIHPPSNVI